MREISRESYRPEVLTGYLAELSRENSLAKSRASSRELSRPEVLTGYLAPELSRENSLAKSRASSRAKQFNNGNNFMKMYVGR